ncbi:MAG: 7TM diverse intracellular signaling domain-containing protein [Polaromonas sp.]
MNQQILKFILVAWLGLLGCVPAMAQTAAQPTPVWQGIQYPADVVIDESGTQSLADIQQRFERSESVPVQGNASLPLGGKRTAWLRIRLPDVAGPADAVLTVVHPGIDYLVFYRPVADGQWQAQYAGDSIPVARWPMPYLHPAFSLQVSPADPRPVYLAVRHGTPVGVYWQLWDRPSFEDHTKILHMALGGYIGFIVLVVILSCFNAFNLRDPIHLVYAAYVVIIGLGQLSLTGLAGEYLWPHNAWWNDIAAVVLPMFSGGWAALLVHRLVVERGHRLVSGLLVVLMLVSTAFATGFMVVGRELIFYSSNLAYLYLFLPILIGSLVWFSIRRPVVGLWALAGFLCLFIGSLFPILRNLQLVPINFYTQFGSQIGAALEIPLLLVALYFRSRERRDNQVRVGALTLVDTLTGVASHRLVMERLDHLLQRQQRDPQAGAVLKVRLVNVAEIRATYGQAIAQAALVRAGACVAAPAQVSDTVGRHADGDFVLLLEGKVSLTQVTEAAQRIIAEGLRPGRKLPADLKMVLHVACADSPLPAGDGEQLLQHLSTVLDKIARHPRRALRFLRARTQSDLSGSEDGDVGAAASVPV